MSVERIDELELEVHAGRWDAILLNETLRSVPEDICACHCILFRISCGFENVRSQKLSVLSLLEIIEDLARSGRPLEHIHSVLCKCELLGLSYNKRTDVERALQLLLLNLSV